MTRLLPKRANGAIESQKIFKNNFRKLRKYSRNKYNFLDIRKISFVLGCS